MTNSDLRASEFTVLRRARLVLIFIAAFYFSGTSADYFTAGHDSGWHSYDAYRNIHSLSFGLLVVLLPLELTDLLRRVLSQSRS